MLNDYDTIVAQATPSGIGGVGIIRLSGSKALDIAAKITSQSLNYFSPRMAKMISCIDQQGNLIDKGLVLYFPNPHSFTGEDVVEIHCHGGPVVVDILIRTLIALGARQARPGEFSERAFLNDKIDLVQAEAIADLIESSSEQAARNAVRSLEGVFSAKIITLVEQLIQLRIYIEAAIDFPDEEGVEFLSDGKVDKQLSDVISKVELLAEEAKQGIIIQEGMSVVLAGEPNAGKSSLLNCLARRDSAIVTAIAGTTRDVLKEKINIDGMPLHIIDTAGLRESPDIIEQEGIRRAWLEIEKADQIIYLVDSEKIDEIDTQRAMLNFSKKLPNMDKLCLLENKVDITEKKVEQLSVSMNAFEIPLIRLSIKNEKGLDLLKQFLKNTMGLANNNEGGFTARRRHLESIKQALSFLLQGQNQLLTMKAGDLLAEDLRLAQNALSEITGAFSSDDLLGRIFSSFCIGK